MEVSKVTVLKMTGDDDDNDDENDDGSDDAGWLPRRIFVPCVRRRQQRGSQLLRVCAGARCHCLFALVVLVEMIINMTLDKRIEMIISRIDYNITK